MIDNNLSGGYDYVIYNARSKNNDKQDAEGAVGILPYTVAQAG